MFLKNNKYQSLIVAIVSTVVLSVLAYKLIDNIGFFGHILRQVYGLTVPFIYGLVIAYILNPLVKWIEGRTKIRRSGAIGLCYVAVLGGITLLSLYFIPGLISSVRDLGANIPGYIEEINQFVNNLLEQEEIKNFITSTGMMGNIQNYIDHVGEMIIPLLEGSMWRVLSLSSIIFNLVLGLLIAIYLLMDKEGLIKEVKRVLYLTIKKERAEKWLDVAKTYHTMIGAYIGIKAIDSAIIGMIAFILLTLVESEFALILSIIVGITNMIPYFGPFIGELIGFGLNVFVSPMKAFMVFLTLFALQMFDGWYLDPKLIGDKVGVRPIWIVYAVVIGGGFFGPIGMLLASPSAATIKIYYHRLLKRKGVE